MNKQYLAFLQSRRSRACERKTDLPFTDKMVCVLVARDPREARIKLKKLVHATCREKNHFLGADCIALVNLIELTVIPDEGMLLSHEFGPHCPALNFWPCRAQAVKIRENARVLWEQPEPFDFGSPEFVTRLIRRSKAAIPVSQKRKRRARG